MNDEDEDEHFERMRPEAWYPIGIVVYPPHGKHPSDFKEWALFTWVASKDKFGHGFKRVA